MYPNQMQQQVSPVQRPPGMMHTTSMPLTNPTVGVPSMRPMVAPSPMQASMIQQQPSPQSSMMVRAGASPYGVMNRVTLFDKNKRAVYPTDPRQQQMIQPGQQAPSMGYGTVMGPNQAMMSNAVPPNAASGGIGPIRPQ